MPFFFIVALWILLLLLAAPLFFFRRLRFIGTHFVGSTMAVIVSFLASTVVLIVGSRLPPSRYAGVAVIASFVVSLAGGGGIGLLIGLGGAPDQQADGMVAILVVKAIRGGPWV